METTPARKPNFFAKVIGAKIQNNHNNNIAKFLTFSLCSTGFVFMIFETAVNAESVENFFSENVALCAKKLQSASEYRKICVRLKVNLHSIRFSSVFFTLLLLLDKVCAFSSAFLFVHIRTNQTVTYWTKVFPKKFFVKGYSSISKYRSYRSYTKFLNKIFINI